MYSSCITFWMMIFVSNVEVFYIEYVSSAGYNMLIEISEMHALYGMYSEKLSIYCNESTEILRKILIIYWGL